MSIRRGRRIVRSFYDRIVRDEQEFRKIWEYIDANPGKWTEDKYYIPIDE